MIIQFLVITVVETVVKTEHLSCRRIVKIVKSEFHLKFFTVIVSKKQFITINLYFPSTGIGASSNQRQNVIKRETWSFNSPTSHEVFYLSLVYT